VCMCVFWIEHKFLWMKHCISARGSEMEVIVGLFPGHIWSFLYADLPNADSG